jgi:CRISPR/Cas system Type II protein with McrA/HNH and RuvC-like nuclease domain
MIDSLKAALIRALATQAYAALVAAPGVGWFFALPLVRQVSQFAIDKIVAWFVQETAVGLSLLWIQIEMAYEIRTAEEARNKLADMINNPQKYSAEEQKRIDEYFDETTVELIQLGIDRLA